MFERKIGAVAAAAVLGVASLGLFLAGAPRLISPEDADVAASVASERAVQARLAKQDEALQVQLAEQHAILERITARLGRMENELKRIPARSIAEDPQAPARTIPADLPADQPSRMTPEQLEETIRAEQEAAMERGRQRLAAIDGGWSSEPVDEGWAKSYEDEIWTALDSPDLGPLSVVDVGCRYSVCKLDLSGDPTVDAEELNAKLVELEPFQNTEFTTTKPEGGESGQIVIYLARPGGQGLSHLVGSP
jgi:hypothetical protein